MPQPAHDQPKVKINLNNYSESLKERYNKDITRYLSRKPVKNYVARTIDVLYIGKPIQKAMLGPFLELMKEKYLNDEGGIEQIDVYSMYSSTASGFDNDPFESAYVSKSDELLYSTENFKVNFIGSRLAGEHSNDFHLNVNLNNEDAINEYEYRNIKFDVIFCYFEMHSVVNWRFTLINLLQYLQEDGIFYYAELVGAISILDGNLDVGVDGMTIAEFQAFKEFRNKSYFWSPELSLTNYSAKDYFLSYFFRGIEKSPLKSNTGGTSDELTISYDLLQGYFDKKSFSFLSEGISKEDVFQGGMLFEKFKQGESFDLDFQINIYAANGFNKARLAPPADKEEQNYFIENLKNSRVSTSFVEGIKAIKDFELMKLGKQALQVAANNDIFFPGITEYLGVFMSAEILNKSEAEFLIHNSGFKDSSIKEDYSKKIKDRNNKLKDNATGYKTPTHLLFTKMNINVPVFVAYLEEGIPIKGEELKTDLGLNNSKPLISIDDGDIKRPCLSFRIDRKRNGNIDYLYIYFTKKFLEIDKPGKQFTENKNKEFLKSEIEIKKVFTFKNIKQLIKSISSLHFNPSDDSFNADNWYSQIIGYFPATLREIGDVGSSNEQVVNLGCFFIKEKLYLKENDNSAALFSLVIARNDLLTRVSDYILHRAGLVHYVNNDYKTYARKAAIAAISARNVSHNIGSHVIPAIKMTDNAKKLRIDIIELKKELLANTDTANISTILNKKLIVHQAQFQYYDDFLDYIEQRNDFINQLTSTNTSWTITVWFVRELMARFLKQFMLLNALGNHESLRIYDYMKYKKSDDSPSSLPPGKTWTEYDSNKEYKGDERIIVYGTIDVTTDDFVIVTDTNEKFVLGDCTIGNICKKHNINGELHEKKAELKQHLSYQTNRKYKVKGKLIVDTPCVIQEGAFIEKYIIIKARLRRYKVKRDDEWTIERYSDYLATNTCFDILSRENNTDNLPEQLDTFVKNYSIKDDALHFYGIIANNDYFHKNELLIAFTHGKTIRVSFKQLESLPIEKEELIPGTRIIFSALRNRCKLGNNEPLGIREAVLKEIAVTRHLLSPSPDVNKEKIILNDVKVSIPGGISGFQSFYTILENAIRNAAKHNWVFLPLPEKIGRNLEVKIELSEIRKMNHYVVKIWANLSNLNYSRAFVTYDDKGKPNPPDLIKSSDSLTKKIDTIFINDIIDESTGEFIKSNLGSTETKINAAYLFNSTEKLTSKENLIGKHVLLNDKSTELLNKGYIKASSIYESFNDQIVPRLGLRIKLKKPKELTIVVGSSQPKFIANLNLKEDETFQILNRKEINFDEEDNAIINGDLCTFISYSDLLVPTEFEDSDKLILLDLVEHIMRLILAKDFGKTLETALLQLTIRIENYPYRLSYINLEYAVLETEGRKYPKGLLKNLKLNAEANNIPQKLLRELIKLFFRRIFIIDSGEFTDYDNWHNGYSTMLSLPPSTSFEIKRSEKLKLFLYDKWIKIHCMSGITIKKSIQLDKQTADDELEPVDINAKKFIPSIPPELFDIYHNPKIFSSSKKATMIQPLGEKEALIRYVRHSTEKKIDSSQLIYLEDLSGHKLSYSLFSIMLNYKDPYNIIKLRLRLLENGLLKFLILDERVMNFFFNDSLNDDFHRFYDMGLFVPYYFKSALNQMDYKWEIPKKQKESLYCKKGSLVEIKNDYFEIKFHMMRNPHGKDSKIEHPVINTIIIHQSILEKIVEGSYNNDDTKRKELLEVIILEFKKNFPSVIVTSGRNKSDFASNTRFLPFSVIEELLFHKNPDKLTLSEILLKTHR